MSDVVAQSLERRGVIIHRQAKLECITAIDPDQEGNEVEYRLSYPDGRAETVRVHKALLSVGRIANTDRLDLAAAGVRTDPRTGSSRCRARAPAFITSTRWAMPPGPTCS